MNSGRVRFGVLGPLEVTVDGQPVAVGPRKQRAVLAMLVINRNRTVSTESLIDAVWGEHAPPETRASLHTYVSNLRKILNDAGVEGHSVLAGVAAGYRLTVPDTGCDLCQFAEKRLAGMRAAAAGDFALAGRYLSDALSLWRGRILEDLPGYQFVETFSIALDEDRIGVHTAYAEAEINCGRGGAVIGMLESLVGEHPYRESLWAQLILAYHTCDRQSDALSAYGRLKAALADGLGVEPAPASRALYERILRQEVLDVHRSALTAAGTLNGRTTEAGQSGPARLRAPSGAVYPVSGAATRIGRLADNDIVLDDVEVSRHHAVVSDTGASFVITDLRSANGVYVRGQRIRGSSILADGDQIRICGHEFAFHADG